MAFKKGDFVKVKKDYSTRGCQAFHDDVKLYQKKGVRLVGQNAAGTWNVHPCYENAEHYGFWTLLESDLIKCSMSMENK